MGTRQGFFLSGILLLSIAATSGALAGDTHWVTNTDDSGPGSLRQCIAEAEPGDEIQFDPSLDGQPILLISGQLGLAKSLSISGRGSVNTIVDANHNSRVAEVEEGVAVALSGMRITGGLDTSFGGGILNQGVLTIEDCQIDGNTVGRGYGGGVHNGRTGTLILERCTVTDNRAVGYWGSRAVGGGINNWGTMSIERSTIGSNEVECLSLDCFNYGGGINNSLFATLSIGFSTISGNHVHFNSETTSGGGGIYSEGALTLKNSTISGNVAYADGGVRIHRGPTVVEDCTITDNESEWHKVGGVSVTYPVATTIRNSIVANQRQGADCFGWISSLGHNLDSDGSCPLDHPTDQPDTDPMLGPLGDNFGPTWTHLPLPGSPVIDAGSCASERDQRGVPRPIDGNGDTVSLCDIGAVEFVPYCDEPDRPCDDGKVAIPGPLSEPFHFPPDSE